MVILKTRDKICLKPTNVQLPNNNTVTKDTYYWLIQLFKRKIIRQLYLIMFSYIECEEKKCTDVFKSCARARVLQSIKISCLLLNFP